MQAILTEKREVLDELAALLSKKEIVQGEELRIMLTAFQQDKPEAVALPKKRSSRAKSESLSVNKP